MATSLDPHVVKAIRLNRYPLVSGDITNSGAITPGLGMSQSFTSIVMRYPSIRRSTPPLCAGERSEQPPSCQPACVTQGSATRMATPATESTDDQFMPEPTTAVANPEWKDTWSAPSVLYSNSASSPLSLDRSFSTDPPRQIPLLPRH